MKTQKLEGKLSFWSSLIYCPTRRFSPVQSFLVLEDPIQTCRGTILPRGGGYTPKGLESRPNDSCTGVKTFTRHFLFSVSLPPVTQTDTCSPLTSRWKTPPPHQWEFSLSAPIVAQRLAWMPEY